MSYPMEEVFTAYVECALWSESCHGSAWEAHTGDCRGEDCDTSLESLGFTAEDLDPETHADMWADVTSFVDGAIDDHPGILDGIEPGQVGHDFWLTRNHHGAGFWDRGLGERGDILTKLSHPYGESNLTIIDGKVYAQ